MKTKLNDLGNKRVSFQNAVKLVEEVIKGRLEGLGQDDAMRYSIMKVKTLKCHSGVIELRIKPFKNGKSPKWMTAPCVINTPERWYSLVETTLHIKSHGDFKKQLILFVNKAVATKRFKNNYDLLRDTVILFLYKILQKTQPRYFKNWARCLNNFSKVTGRKITNRMKVSICSHSYYYKDWKNISRGRDLFLLWSFDINKVVETLHTDLFPVDSIYRRVYCSTEKMIKLHKEYLKRWSNWLREGDNVSWLNRLDELNGLILEGPHERHNENIRVAVMANSQVRPDILIARAERMYEIYKARRDGMYPPTLYYTAEEKLNRYKIPIQEYNIPLPVLTVEDSTLKPISSSLELSEVSIKLQNCAINYHKKIVEDTSRLVGIYKQDEVIGLAELDHHNNVVQCSGPHNVGSDYLNKVVDHYVEQLR